MNVFTILSDLVRFGEKKLIIVALVAFSGVLTISSKYVASEGAAGMPSGMSPLERPVLMLQYAAIAISLLLMLLRWKLTARSIFRDPFLWGLALMAPLSFLWSDFSDLSMRRGISSLQTMMFGIYLGSRYPLKEQLRLIAWAMAIIVVFTILFTLAFPGSGIEQGIHSGSWRGPLVHKNLLSRQMVMALIPLLLMSESPESNHRFRWRIGFGMAIALVALTGSKTGLLAAIALIFLVPLFKGLRGRGNIMIPILIALLLIGSSALTWLIQNWEPFLYGLGKDPTLSGRTEVWAASIDQIRQRPWFGYGFQAFWKGGGGAEYVWLVAGYRLPHAHNGFVNIALDLGLVGLSLWLLSLVTIFVRGIKLLRITKSAAELWPLLYTSFLFLYNQSESTIIEHNNLFWILHAAVTCSVGYVRRLTPEEKADFKDQETQTLTVQKSGILYPAKGEQL